MGRAKKEDRSIEDYLKKAGSYNGREEVKAASAVPPTTTNTPASGIKATQAYKTIKKIQKQMNPNTDGLTFQLGRHSAGLNYKQEF